MQAIGVVLYIGLGIVQLFAIMDGVEQWWGLSGIFAGIIGFIIAGLPLIGSIVGYIGATDVWGWAWWQAGLLFFGGMLLTLAVGASSAILEKFSRA